MKNSSILLIFFGMLLFSACGDAPARPDSILTEAQKLAADNAAQAAEAGGVQAAPAGIAGLPHYYCANSCEGSGGGSQGNCPTCGTPYTHNDAFHNQTPTTAPATAPTSIINTPTLGSDGTNITTTPLTPTATTPPPSPAQNANGVFHYTCSTGCAGGAAGAGNCGTCGGALAHNAEYHN